MAGALVMTRPEASEQVVRDCAEAGVPRVWLHRGIGPGAVSRAAVDFCRLRGIAVVADLEHWKAHVKCQSGCPVRTDAGRYVQLIAGLGRASSFARTESLRARTPV